ncbi:MAG TPA: hypothetical protein VN933_16930 [Candidatus Eremiobacteraceae bacterium]|jgi:hypothetical protein|nr:hypothetical protein [Candidatus Eremiobacteraceae bacterium]
MCRTVMAERSGESANDASDTFTTGTKRQQKSSTQYEKKFGEKDGAQGGREADTKAHSAEASSGTEGSSKAGASGKGCSGSVGAGAVQAMQGRVVGNRGTHPERARYALRMPVLPEVAPSAWSGAGV